LISHEHSNQCFVCVLVLPENCQKHSRAREYQVGIFNLLLRLLSHATISCCFVFWSGQFRFRSGSTILCLKKNIPIKATYMSGKWLRIDWIGRNTIVFKIGSLE
jgi:hypothetical protein